MPAITWVFLRPEFSRDAMRELTNQQTYDYYHEVKESCAKAYWLQFLKDRANRGMEGAQGYIDKIEYYTSS